MTNLTSVFIFIPGALEAGLFLLIFLGLFAFRQKATSKMIPECLAYAFTLRFLFQIGADLIREQWNPWLLATLVVLAIVSYALSRSDSKGVHWSAVLVSLVLYFGAFQAFTYVKKSLTTAVIWEIDDATQSNFKQETVMHFQFKEFPNHGFAIASSAIANILRSKGGNVATAELDALYHWGAFAGYSLNKLNSVPIPLDTPINKGCGDDCSNPPFKAYSF